MCVLSPRYINICLSIRSPSFIVLKGDTAYRTYPLNWMDGSVDGWVGGLSEEWMDGWVDRWGQWIDGLIDSF